MSGTVDVTRNNQLSLTASIHYNDANQCFVAKIQLLAQFEYS
jgi:hypothetical protein